MVGVFAPAQVNFRGRMVKGIGHSATKILAPVIGRRATVPSNVKLGVPSRPETRMVEPSPLPPEGLVVELKVLGVSYR